MSPIEKLRLRLDNEMRFNYLVLKLVGLYPFEEKTKNQKIKLYISCVFICIASILLNLSVRDSFKESIVVIIERCSVSAAFYGGTVKFFYLWKAGDKYGKIINSLRDELYEDNSIFSAEEYEPLFKKYDKIKKMFFVLFSVASSGCHIIFGLFPIILMYFNTYVYGKEFEYLLPFNMTLPFLNYYVHYFVEFTAELLLNTAYVVCDMIHLDMSIQLCIHISCLCNVIKNLVLDKHKEIIKNHVPSEIEFQQITEQCNKRLQTIVQRHIKILMFVNINIPIYLF